MTVDPKVVFFFLAALILLPVGYLIISKNVIRSAFAFGFSLLSMAAMYVLLQAEFMAIVQILIYAGGVVVLLIFGVMLSRSSNTKGVFTAHHFVVPAVLLTLLLVVTLVSALQGERIVSNNPIEETDLTHRIGVLLLSEHLLAFELVAYLLLVVLVGATFISKKVAE